MSTKKTDAVKVQATVTGKAARLYEMVNSKSKSAAITAALLLLARNKRMREIFFPDAKAIDKLLGVDEDKAGGKTKQEDGW